MNLCFQEILFEKSETKIDEKNKKITRGWYDFKALNLKNIIIQQYSKIICLKKTNIKIFLNF